MKSILSNYKKTDLLFNNRDGSPSELIDLTEQAIIERIEKEIDKLKENILLEVYRVLKPQQKHPTGINSCNCNACEIKDFIEKQLQSLFQEK